MGYFSLFLPYGISIFIVVLTLMMNIAFQYQAKIPNPFNPFSFLSIWSTNDPRTFSEIEESARNENKKEAPKEVPKTDEKKETTKEKETA